MSKTVRNALVIYFGLALYWLFAVQSSFGQTNTIPFIYGFNETNLIIELSGDSPYAQYGMVIETNEVIISASNQAVRVMDWNGTLVYSNTATCSNTFAPGHYYIETEGDRHNLCVLPDTFGTPHGLGVHTTGSGDPHNSLNNAIIFRPTSTTTTGWERTGNVHWYNTETNDNTKVAQRIKEYLDSLGFVKP